MTLVRREHTDSRALKTKLFRDGSRVKHCGLKEVVQSPGNYRDPAFYKETLSNIP